MTVFHFLILNFIELTISFLMG